MIAYIKGAVVWLEAKLTVFWTCVFAGLCALPDVLNALGAVDMTALIPGAWGTRLAAFLGLLRAFLPLIVKSMSASKDPA